MTNHPQKGHNWAHMTNFACAPVDLVKFRHGTLLIEIDNAIDNGPLLLSPMVLDANDAIH